MSTNKRQQVSDISVYSNGRTYVCKHSQNAILQFYYHVAYVRLFIYLFVYRAGRRRIARVVSECTYYTEEPQYFRRRNIVRGTIRTRVCVSIKRQSRVFVVFQNTIIILDVCNNLQRKRHGIHREQLHPMAAVVTLHENDKRPEISVRVIMSTYFTRERGFENNRIRFYSRFRCLKEQRISPFFPQS